MSSANFRTIRPIRGSANNGFEELCCQLAHAESAPVGSDFIRNGTPDGGVEGYRIFADGSEHGWQAKYFFELGPSQWQQLDDSVETALRTHPGLLRYTICLPMDLPDARVDGQRSLRQKWDERVKRWEDLVSGRGMAVTFELWGEHELLTRLSVEAHSGRRWFWFNESELSPAWFDRHLGEAVAGAGPRYNSEFNVDLPIALRFEALGYTRAFREEFAARREKCRERSGRVLRCLSRLERAEFIGAKEDFERSDRSLSGTLDLFREDMPGAAIYGTLERSLGMAVEAADLLLRTIHRAAESSPRDPGSGTVGAATRPFEHELHAIRQYRSGIEDLRGFLTSSSGELVGRPAMLLAGDAGSGKTHLLCDVAKGRIESGLPTIVLLGQQFGRGDVWRQILERLGLTCTREELLGALEAAAQAAGGRALIFIDAINESPESDWLNSLPPFLEVLSRYSRIGTAISCRSTYERYLVRDDLIPARLTRVEHQGFAPKLFEALAAFCRHYDLETLNTPPLAPEFENPLFLKLFCKGLHDRGMRRPPKGHHGLQRIFSFLVESVNEKLHHPSELDYPADDRVVQRAVDAIADAMVDAGRNTLPRPQARAILGAIHPGCGQGYSKSLLQRLISEGLLADDLHFGGRDDVPEPVVRFGYERLADFQFARRLLDRHLTEVDPEAAFGACGVIGRMFDDEGRSYRHRGLLSALIVLVPERIGRELAEVMPHVAEWHSYPGAFLEGLPWREGRHVTEHALRTVEALLEEGNHGAPSYSAADKALDRIIQLAGIPEHPLNARWLHAKLLRMTLPERDWFWSTYLHRSWAWENPHGSSAIGRLFDWAWPGDPGDVDPLADCDREVLELAATAVAWCFTTPNRFVRDKATKTLACLLSNHPGLIPDLLDTFSSVDDLYVSERLYCATFGAVVRQGSTDALRPVAQATYDRIFSGGNPPPHLLLRDYAREIIEYAVSIGCTFDFDIAGIRPPYRSEPPPEKAATWDELHKLYSGKGYGGLILSLWPPHGDFARYVMHCDSSGLHTWVSTPDPFDEVRLLAKERIELPQPLAARWCRASVSRMLDELDWGPFAGSGEPSDGAGSEGATSQDLPPEATEVGETDDKGEGTSILESLSPDELLLLERHEEAESRYREALDRAMESVKRQHGDGHLPCCWVLTRVMELGWTPERFDAFDRAVNRDDAREARKPERVGKKYQWIAYHELAARVTDHRRYQHEYYPESIRYEGPWQRSFRDIDPTFLAKAPPTVKADRCWWLPVTDPLDEFAGLGDQEWLGHGPSVPHFGHILKVASASGSSPWLALRNSHEWRVRDGGKDGESLSRRLSFSLDAMLVRAADLPKILEGVSEGHWTGRDASCPDLDEQFLGEFAWAPSFEDLRVDAADELAAPADDRTIQRTAFGPDGPRAAWPVTRCLFSREFDCSRTEAIGGFIPSPWLAGRMGLSWARRRLRFVDGSGRTVALDPSHEEPGPGAFLVDEATLVRFLRAHDLTLIWLVIGSKMLMEKRDDWPDDRSGPRVSIFRQVYELGTGTENPVLRTIGLLGSAGASY